jgi:hypothetical protein
VSTEKMRQNFVLMPFMLLGEEDSMLPEEGIFGFSNEYTGSVLNYLMCFYGICQLRAFLKNYFPP